MNIVVLIREVPDLSEELEIAPEGTDIDRAFLSSVINEFDEQAVEEAALLKEETGATVTVVALDGEDVDNILYTALAKGGDKGIKVRHSLGPPVSSRLRAAAFAQVLGSIDYDLILTGVQSAEDWDGQVGPLVAASLDLPWLEVVNSVQMEDGRAVVQKEYKGGLMAEFEVDTPAVLGIQAARKPPRYAPVSRIRQVMNSDLVEEIDLGDLAAIPSQAIRRLSKPESQQHAEMIEGNTGQVVERIVDILKTNGILA